MANRVTTWSDGDVLYAAALNGEFDNIYAGAVDRTGGRWGQNDAIPVTFGSSQDCSFQYSAVQTNDALVIGLGTDSRSIIVCDEGDKATNWGYAAATNPTLFVHSASTTAAEVASLSYSRMFINDVADTDCTMGVTINQGTNTDKIVTFKQSNVAHGITTTGQFGVETDTYGAFGLWDVTGTVSGLLISGYGSEKQGICIAGSYVTGDTTKTVSADAPVTIIGQKKTGTTVGVMASDENILVIKDYQTPKFVFDCMGLMVIPGWDLGDGHEGPGIKIGRNSNVTNQGAGYLSLTDKAGTVYYLWVDATGDLRIHTAAPVTTNDLAGTVVGAQS